MVDVKKKINNYNVSILRIHILVNVFRFVMENKNQKYTARLSSIHVNSIRKEQKTYIFFVELLIYMATDMMYTINKLKLHHKVTSYYTKHRN